MHVPGLLQVCVSGGQQLPLAQHACCKAVQGARTDSWTCATCWPTPNPSMLSIDWVPSCVATLHGSSHWTPSPPVANILGSVCIVQRAQCLLLALDCGSDGRNDAGLGAPAQGVPQQPRQLAVPAPGSSCSGRSGACFEGPAQEGADQLAVPAPCSTPKCNVGTNWQWRSFRYIRSVICPAHLSADDRQQ